MKRKPAGRPSSSDLFQASRRTHFRNHKNVTFRKKNGVQISDPNRCQYIKILIKRDQKRCPNLGPETTPEQDPRSQKHATQEPEKNGPTGPKSCKNRRTPGPKMRLRISRGRHGCGQIHLTGATDLLPDFICGYWLPNPHTADIP